MKKFLFPFLLFVSTFNILPVMLNQSPDKCVTEVQRERRENVSGTEFCWTPPFSCPSLTEEIVWTTENVTLCCPGFMEDTEGNCEEIVEEEKEEEEIEEKSASFILNFNCNEDCDCSGEGCDDNSHECNCRDYNLFYLLVILPLITLIILILVLVMCIIKMRAKLRALNEHRTREVMRNKETTNGNTNNPVETERGKTAVNNPLYYYENSGFCTISEKNIYKDSTVKVAIHKGSMIIVLRSKF